MIKTFVFIDFGVILLESVYNEKREAFSRRNTTPISVFYHHTPIPKVSLGRLIH